MSDTIKIKKNDVWKYAAFILGALVIVLVIYMFNSRTSETITDDSGNTIPGRIEANIDDDAMIGDADAKVTIIEFSDYECPFCKRHHDQTLPSLKAEYIETGKIKYIFRDFTPTLANPNYHPNAINAAMAAECVGEQGGDEAYWQMHEALFANQGSNTADSVKNLAQTLGYDISSCLDSSQTKAEVEKDFADGRTYGIQGTPGFLIGSNGEYTLLSGACPYSAFKQAIDAELAGDSWYSPGNCQVVVN